MAATASLSDETRATVSSQAAAMMAVARTKPTAKPVRNLGIARNAIDGDLALGEDFPYVAIGLHAVVKPPKDLASLYEPQGLWLHLIRSGAAASHYVVSDARGMDNAHAVISLTHGDLPSKIFSAVQWLDKNDSPDNTDPVCVVTVPGLYTYLVGVLRAKGPTAVVVAAPDEVKLVGEGWAEVPLGKVLTALKKSAQVRIKK